MSTVIISEYFTLGLRAYFRFEGGWGGCQGAPSEDMVGALGISLTKCLSYTLPGIMMEVE